jgi:uncharacterized protein YcaQ
VELPDTRVVDRLSADEARRIVVRAQGLDRQPGAEGSVEAMLPRLGAVQLDTISVLARSHELVAYARLGPVTRAAVEQAYWAEPARTFEYIGHAGCIMPVDLWPYFAFRRRALRERRPPLERRTQARLFEEVLARLRDGPVNDRPGWREGERRWLVELVGGEGGG